GYARQVHPESGITRKYVPGVPSRIGRCSQAFSTIGLAASFVACGTAPMAPTRSLTTQDFAGSWQVQWQVTTCVGSRQCPRFVGNTVSSSLRLLVTATNAVGVLTLAGRDRIDVTGTIGTDGTLTLGGSKPAASPLDGSGEVELTRFLVRRDLQKGLVGE